MGLVKTRKDGNRLYYTANTDHPISPEIRRLVEKTSGYITILKEILAVPSIQIAFIFGSVASGKARPDSDLDLFIIGNLGLRKVSHLLAGVTDRIGSLVNPHVVSPDGFVRKLKEKNHFITNVMESPKTLVIGTEDDLKRLGKK